MNNCARHFSELRLKKLTFPLLLLVLLLAPGISLSEPVDSSEFAAHFLNPPAESRILKIIHSWPDDPAQQDALIHSLSGQGFGGVVCNVSFADYLESESKWKAFGRAVAEARKAGFALWLYDEKGYPSATAGGLVLQDHPEWEARGLLIAETEVENAIVRLDLPPGAPKLVAAFPLHNSSIQLEQRTNLTAFVSAGRLSWRSPAGHWLVLAITEDRLYEGTHASLSLSAHIPYPNLLEPEPTARFLELTHQAYAEHLGDKLGKDFISTFTDEPSLMSLFLRRMPYRPLPWSSKLPAIFRRRHGYEIEEKLPALVADAGPETARVRFDYWQTVGELVADNYFGQIQRWCHQHQLRSGGHLLMEENLVNQVALYGDFFGCLRRLDAPSIDCLTSIPEQVPWYIARLAGSAADLEQRPITMCETSDHSQRYRPPGDKRPRVRVTPGQIRGTCNRLIVSGIDTITSYYSFDGLKDEQLRALNEYIGRCCCALKGGHRAADIAVLYPTESAWIRFAPSRHYANDAPAAAQIETIFHDVSDSLFAAGRDFTYVDARALAEAKVHAGALAHGRLRWRVVILPGADTLPLKAWQNLERFVSSGGVLLSIGAVPRNSEAEFPSARVQKLGNQIFGLEQTSEPHDLGSHSDVEPRVCTNSAGGGGVLLPAGLASLVPLVLDGLLERDCQTTGDRSPLKYTHRQIKGVEVYFLINDSNQRWKGAVNLCGEGAGEACDPATGQTHALASARDISLDLAPYGSMIFRFARARLPDRFKIREDLLPQFVCRKLTVAEPGIGRGEFVREQLVDLAPPRDSSNENSPPKWRVTGAITRSQVDTFLFLQFAVSRAAELQEADSLVLDTWVPQGQKSPTQLLVILHEKDGADYLASTGRLLSAPGFQRTWVPWTRFQLAGWSKDPDGRLDLDQIADVRVGWGGYLGTEGEKVEFHLAPPQAAAVSTRHTP